MPLTRRLFSLSCLALAACGATDGPPADPGVLFPARFGDNHPIDFTAPQPGRFAVHGIDAARFQSDINWNEARRSGVNFAFLKATEGGDIFDPMFRDHWRGASRAAVERGAYHFYYFCTSPEVQARWFIRNVPRSPGALPPVLDMEWNASSPTCASVRPPAAEVRDRMRRWIKIVSAHYGQRPIIYTTPEFYRENGLGQFNNHDFWLRSTAENPSKTFPGQRWRFWQYSSTGTVPGISGEVDLNAFSGSPEDWSAWVARRKLQ